MQKKTTQEAVAQSTSNLASPDASPSPDPVRGPLCIHVRLSSVYNTRWRPPACEACEGLAKGLQLAKPVKDSLEVSSR